MTKDGDALAARNGVLNPKFKRAWAILAEQEDLTDRLFGDDREREEGSE